jgi:hypothetical protein
MSKKYLAFIFGRFYHCNVFSKVEGQNVGQLQFIQNAAAGI